MLDAADQTQNVDAGPANQASADNVGLSPELSGPARRILCVFPRYEPSLGSLEYAYDITGTLRAFMPPQGLLVIAAALPEGWEARFVDENIARAKRSDFKWADAVFVSGMHVQRRQIDDIRRRAQKYGKPAALGGPSVSACPEFYPDFDYLHIGEMGDATRELFARLSRDCARPEKQIRFETRERTPLEEFPIPAYELVSFENYFIGSIQFSSGCPYRCEFCDIPGLYGRVPRLKSPQRIVAELDKLRECGLTTSVYFVDDNLIANRRALRELLPVLIEWQEKNSFPLSFAFEATLNIARYDDLLSQLRLACFTTIFVGVETPEEDALVSLDKEQNMTLPILEAVRRLNAHGMEVVAGIIVGLDTDGPQTQQRIIDFIEASQIPMLTINLLQALPKTPLWDRLEKEGRLCNDEGRESNVVFLRSYDETVATWRNCLRHAYDPARLFARYHHLTQHTFPNRRPRPRPPGQVTPKNVRRGFTMLFKICWKLGVIANYRRIFWDYAWPRIKTGRIEDVISVGILAKHLITYARKACAGKLNASNYSAKVR
ncbi:B12-binding domain-containing radical SAM protein [Methylocystis sp. WRRC1]|uniref:B12-binding domain-containing radical SAM protein n=1 Tax=Methylocystis sp. WRRC1 TaxID=1732014 RepID=UPI001D1508AE|nr:B12-binding domain-containing radical SAM protein [Methylocystis sp. WRRC1]MCC3245364.1 B12-binding domain-containing radical SAM protein [Methylocystis sp. WRRC1]